MMNRRPVVLVALTFAFLAASFPVAIGAFGIVSGCGTGAKVSGGLQLKVDPQNCQEKPGGPVSTELVSLSCLQGEATVTVTFPRREWMSMKTRLLAPSDAGDYAGK